VRWRTRFACWSVARTWCLRRIGRRCGIVWLRPRSRPVRFTRPNRIDFRLVRGPVPHVVETFVLTPSPQGTRLDYDGELGTDLWRLGQWWGDIVAERWEAAVAASFETIKAESERRTR
jgi:hypothetical protein